MFLTVLGKIWDTAFTICTSHDNHFPFSSFTWLSLTFSNFWCKRLSSLCAFEIVIRISLLVSAIILPMRLAAGRNEYPLLINIVLTSAIALSIKFCNCCWHLSLHLATFEICMRAQLLEYPYLNTITLPNSSSSSIWGVFNDKCYILLKKKYVCHNRIVYWQNTYCVLDLSMCMSRTANDNKRQRREKWTSQTEKKSVWAIWFLTY